MNMKLYSPRNVSGGTIDGAVIGGTTPAAGTFTTGEFASVKITNGQIAFPATAVPSSDPNTLDDYEEGTWTPSIGGTATYNAQTGTYTKFGDRVSFDGNIDINVIGTGNTTTATGAPFASSSLGSLAVSYWADLAVNTIAIGGYLNGTDLLFTGRATSGSTSDNGIALFGNNAEVFFSGVYKI
jgi:hypothetical protein